MFLIRLNRTNFIKVGLIGMIGNFKIHFDKPFILFFIDELKRNSSNLLSASLNPI